VAGDLLVHLLSGMQFVLGINEIPKRVSAFGGIYRWNDGRNTPTCMRAVRVRGRSRLHAPQPGH